MQLNMLITISVVKGYNNMEGKHIEYRRSD